MFSLLSAPFRDHQVAQQVAQRAELTPYNHWIRKQYNPNSKLPNALFTCLSGVLLLVCLFIIIIICFGRLFAFVFDATQQKQTKLKTYYNALKHFTTHLQRRTTSQVRTRSSIPISNSWDRAYSQSLADLRAQVSLRLSKSLLTLPGFPISVAADLKASHQNASNNLNINADRGSGCWLGSCTSQSI